MVNTAGVVTRRTNVFPQLQQVKFDCMKCGYVLGPFFQHAEGEVKPNSCPQCQGKGPFTVCPLSRPCPPALSWQIEQHWAPFERHPLPSGAAVPLVACAAWPPYWGPCTVRRC